MLFYNGPQTFLFVRNENIFRNSYLAGRTMNADNSLVLFSISFFIFGVPPLHTIPHGRMQQFFVVRVKEPPKIKSAHSIVKN